MHPNLALLRGLAATILLGAITAAACVPPEHDPLADADALELIALDEDAAERVAAEASTTNDAADYEEVKSHLVEHVFAIQALGPGAQDVYAASIRELRRTPAVTARAAQELYEETGSGRYLDRWALVRTMAAMRRPETIALLGRIGLEPMPAPRAGHGDETLPHEAMIRAAALAGLGRLAADGRADALELLEAALEHEDPYLKLRAVEALVAVDPRPAAKDALRAKLSPEHAWMIDPPVGDLARDGHLTPPPADSRVSAPTTIPAPHGGPR